MIFGHDKWSFGEFSLVAREAARRFARWRGNVSGRRGSWRPLFLRWRQWRRRRENTFTGRAANLPPVRWFPQFHFHYASFENSRTPRDRSVDHSFVAGTSATLVVVEQHWTSNRAGTAPPPQYRAYRSLRPFFLQQRLQPRSTAELTDARARWEPPIAHSIDTPVAPRQQPLLFGTTPESLRPRKQSEARTQTFRSYLRSSQYWLQTFRVRTPTAGIQDANRSLPNHTSRVQFALPEELVWRRVKRTRAEVSEVENQQAPGEFSQRPASRTFETERMAQVSHSADQAATMQITKIDPTLLERLTDDVIRRVEQRARIERQRRGL